MATYQTLLISSLVTLALGAQTYYYMDSKKSCGQSVQLDDDNQFKVQTLDDATADSPGYFPCYLVFYSNDEVVCLSPLLFNFINCTMQLSYYMFSGDIPDVSTLTLSKLITCKSEMKTEWCTPQPANVIIGFEKLQPDVSISNFFFLLDVAQITSSYRSTFMFSNCGLTTHLHHSKIHVFMSTNYYGEKSCTKTFSYFLAGEDRERSELCVEFERWPRGLCSSFKLQIFDSKDDSHSPYKTYACSKRVPKKVCFESSHMTLKIVASGNISDERENFKLQVWDSYVSGEDGQTSSGPSTRTIIIIACCCSFGGLVIMFCIAICCCKKRGMLVNWPSFPSFPSLPSLPSAPSLPSLAGGNDD